MGHTWDTVAIVCFCILGSMVMLAIVKVGMHLVVVYRWEVNERRKARPADIRSLGRAIVLLEAVTDKVESLPGGASLYECPICLFALTIRTAVLVTNITPPPPAHVHTWPPTSDTVIDIEACAGPPPPAPAAGEKATAKSGDKTVGVTTTETEVRADDDDDDILRLKRCLHIFHARCLAAWLLQGRHDCPVCRTCYYQADGDERRRDNPPTGQANNSLPLMPLMPFW